MLKPLATLILVSSAFASAQVCTPNASHTAAGRALELQHRLLSASVGSMDTDVPAAMKPVLHDFKQTLIATVETAMRCDAAGITNPAQLQSGLVALLHANRPPKPQPKAAPASTDDNSPDKGTYGDMLRIAVAPLTGDSGSLSIQVGYTVECGADNILFLYHRDPAGWRRTLTWQNPDLNSVGDAFGDLFYFASVPSPVPALVVVHGTPWCTSYLSEFKADLIALAQPGKPQHLLDHTEHDYRRSDPTSFRPEPNGFEIKALVDVPDETEMVGSAVLRYATTSGRLDLQATAPSARAFLSMWSSAAWPQAARWSDPANLPALEQRHKELGEDALHAGPVLACTGQPNHFQVGLPTTYEHAQVHVGKDGSESFESIHTPDTTFYAQVQTNSATQTFTMLAITPQPDPACTGPDLMKRPSHKAK